MWGVIRGAGVRADWFGARVLAASGVPVKMWAAVGGSLWPTVHQAGSSPAISITRSTTRRRSFALGMRTKVLTRASPSEVARKSVTYSGEGASPNSFCLPGGAGAPSKKNDTETCRISEICCRRLAPIRLVPFSYFCTCWNVRPSASPSFSWLIPSIMRRIRTRLPTCLSVGLGAFLAITISYAPTGRRNVHFWRPMAMHNLVETMHHHQYSVLYLTTHSLFL